MSKSFLFGRNDFQIPRGKKKSSIDISMWKKVHFVSFRFDFVHPKSHFHLRCRFYFVWLARCRSLNWTCTWLSKMKCRTLETHKFWNIVGLFMSRGWIPTLDLIIPFRSKNNLLLLICNTLLQVDRAAQIPFLNCYLIVEIYSSGWKIQAHVLTSVQPDVMNVLHLTSIFFSKLINELNRKNWFLSCIQRFH